MFCQRTDLCDKSLFFEIFCMFRTDREYDETEEEEEEEEGIDQDAEERGEAGDALVGVETKQNGNIRFKYN